MKGKFHGVSFRDPPSIDLLDPHLSGLSNLGGHAVKSYGSRFNNEIPGGVFFDRQQESQFATKSRQFAESSTLAFLFHHQQLKRNLSSEW